MFIGRKEELNTLKEQTEGGRARFIVVRGRRRIGKSSLIEKFARQNQFQFLKIEGLAPAVGQSNQDQLDHFSKQLSRQSDWISVKLVSWEDAFVALANSIPDGKVVLLLDEISWLGGHDKNFCGYLKTAWDNSLKKQKNLLLFLCGSVSTWIANNILNHTAFIGRLNYVLELKELNLAECSQFWGKAQVSSFEKYKFLSVTGGIPRYLEELNPKKSAEKNIYNLAFQSGGLLYLEFDDLFNGKFNLELKTYRQILIQLLDGPKTFVGICRGLGVEKNGVISEYLDHLRLAGFIARDYNVNRVGKLAKLSAFRLSDNYSRFYLKYLLPNRDNIEKNIFSLGKLENLPQWSTILGLQFQNLMNNNLKLILNCLEIDLSQVIFAGPYFQNAKKGRCPGIEIDLLIQTRQGTHYIVECKFRKSIQAEVLDEVALKMRYYLRSKNIAVRPVLVYEGELSSKVQDADFFAAIIPAEKFLEYHR